MENRTVNEQVFNEMLAVVDPGLWRVKQKLVIENVNPDVLPSIIEALSHINHTTKYGSVVITMENGVVTMVKGNTLRKVDITV